MEADPAASCATPPGRALGRGALMQHAPPRGVESCDRSLDNRIARLRRKLERNPDLPAPIKTVRGAGWRESSQAGSSGGQPIAKKQ